MMIAYHLARFRLWLHCAMASAPAANHGPANWFVRNAPSRVACACGRVFWEKE